MSRAVIHTVTTLDLDCPAWDWPFARERRAEIAAHFAARQAEKPQLFNGRVLLGRNPVFSVDRLSADYFETDFASFLAWRDWGFPDRDVFNGFGMGALRCADGAFVLGEMGQHTANAGKVYFPSGTPDPDDVRGARLDIKASVIREVFEETGLSAETYRMDGHWHCVVSGHSIAMMGILHIAGEGDEVRLRIERDLARQASPELAAIHLVRSRADLTPMMPVFVTAFLEAQLPSD